MERERPLEGGGQRVKTRRAPRPYQALSLGGRSPPRPCCPVRHRRPGGDERNSKRPHGIGESGVCASSGVHCVHRLPTSHARSSTAQVVGFSSESRPHEPNRPPCVGALHQPPTRLPARTLRQRDAALHGGLQAAVLHEDPDITLDDGLVDKVDLAADPVVEFGGVGIPRPVGEHGLRPAVLLRCPDDGHDLDGSAAIPERLPEFAVRRAPGAECRSAASADGTVIRTRTRSGLIIQAGGDVLNEVGDSSSEAQWEAALITLWEADLLSAEGLRDEVYRLTALGWQLAARIGS